LKYSQVPPNAPFFHSENMYPGSEYISVSSGVGNNLSAPSNSQNGFEARH